MKSSRKHSLLSNPPLLMFMLILEFAGLQTLSLGSGPMSGGGGGGGFGIGINIGPPPMAPGPGMGGWTYTGTTSQAEIDRAQTEIIPEGGRGGGGGSGSTKVAVQPQPQERRSKLSKPRVRYLDDLAIDVDPALMQLAITAPAKALEDNEQMLARARKAGDQRSEREALTNLGNLYFLIGWFSRGNDRFQQLLNLAVNTGNYRLRAKALNGLAATLIAWGDYSQAEGYIQPALLIYVETADSAGKRMVLNNLGVLARYKGSFDPARSKFEEALRESAQDNRLKLKTLLNVARLDRQWGFKNRAVQQFNQALATARQLSDPAMEADITFNLAELYMDAGDNTRALQLLNMTLSRLASAGARTDWVNKIIADAYLDMGLPDQAESFARAADYDSTLGRLHFAKSEPQAARTAYKALLKTARNEGNLDETFTALVGLGKTDEVSGNLNQARENYAQALKVLDEIRSTLLPSERKNFDFTKVNGFSRPEPARGLIRIALRQNRAVHGILPGELVRATNFSDNLSRNIDFESVGLPRETLEKETAASNKLASLKTALNSMPKALEPRRFQDISNQIGQTQSEANAIQKEVASKHKRYAALRYPKPVSLAESLIKPDEYVLMYQVLGDGIGIQLLKGKTIVKSSHVSMKEQQLEGEIKEFRRSFETAQLDKFDPQKAAELYSRLVGDLLKDVPATAPITIIPDGSLALLPFDALVIQGTAKWKNGTWGAYPTGLTYLGDRHPIVYYPSLTALTHSRSAAVKKEGQGRTLVMADPVFNLVDERVQAGGSSWQTVAGKGEGSMRLMASIEDETGGFFKLPRLPETANLVKTCKGLYGDECDAFTGMESSKSAFMNQIAPKLDTYKSLIFGTHGFTANDIPGIMEPALALSMVPPGTDGFLTMSEVAALKMNPDMVALTACQTGVGVQLAGEGIMSMGRAFLAAGAKSVAMSLWSVSEQSSVKLMSDFFRNLKEGKGKVQAWTEARNGLRSNGFEHPFFWAAFVFVGEPN